MRTPDLHLSLYLCSHSSVAVPAISDWGNFGCHALKLGLNLVATKYVSRDERAT